MINQDPMQNGSADAIRRAMRKNCLRSFPAAHKANAPEGMDLVYRNLDAQFAQGLESIGHQSFATWFVDRRNRAIGDDNAQPATARGHRSRQPGRSSADYEDVNRILQTTHHERPTTPAAQIPNRTPAPSPQEYRACPA